MELADTILRRAHAREPGAALFASDFADLGERPAVHQALSRLARAGALERLGRGIYRVATTPRQPVDVDAVTRAVARREGVRAQPTGAHAAHLLGLSDDVPMRVAYLTDGKARTFHLGKRTVALRHVAPRRMAAAGRVSGTVIQALQWLGPDAVTADVERSLRTKLPPEAKLQLIADVKLAPAWMGGHLLRIAEGL